MQVIIDELMQIFEITDIKYFAILIMIVFGSILLAKKL